MSGKRIGERLSNIIPLTGHDIEEILAEQSATGKRFGDIAIQLGLAAPEDVWRAWGTQLAEAPQRVDLHKFHIDSQAVMHIPSQIAIRYHIIPVRILDNELVIAVDESAYPDVVHELFGVINYKVKYILCSHRQIAESLRSYYPRASAA
jgi:type IV pilus assembly protein PilB